MKRNDLREMVLDSIAKLGGSTKKEYVADVVDTAIKLGVADRDFMIRLAGIGWEATCLKTKGTVKTDKNNTCDCGRCKAGSVDGLHSKKFIWSLV